VVVEGEEAGGWGGGGHLLTAILQPHCYSDHWKPHEKLKVTGVIILIKFPFPRCTRVPPWLFLLTAVPPTILLTAVPPSRPSTRRTTSAPTAPAGSRGWGSTSPTRTWGSSERWCASRY
jgi:hypothetical protein